MYKEKRASGDAYIYRGGKRRVRQSNLGKGHTTLWRENRRRGNGRGEGGGVLCSIGLMIYCRFFEITSGREMKARDRMENLKRDANPSTVIASPLLCGCHVFKGQLITSCHHAAWNNRRGLFLVSPSYQTVSRWASAALGYLLW